ncbi:glycoside hydrolase family 88 protein [Konateibacter massiliensis]|uniref:glycoside hydrolase family 88 protein n=1 Tax=Konateibacter massiliensis TaxID=2002841 RepID=UPI000C159E4D|nr:glycoside hydrolase family 88 protein [Konateibacter massiliensis]
MKEYEIWAETVIEKIREKMDWVSEKNADKIPYTTDETGNYDDRSDASRNWSMDDGLNWWTNGFWGGMMWLMYQDTKDEKYAKIAAISQKKLEKCFESYYGLHHDVGFMFVPTAVTNYRLTGNPESRKTAMHAANLLAGRFNPVGKFIRAWNEVDDSDTRGWAIIDCMFNISLLYWASEESKDPRFAQIARLHADTVLEHFIRPDGSVNHIVEFNPETGEFVKSYGGQGYDQGSSWSRGQGWAVYGFMNSYTHTGKEEYLNAAKKVAHYCIANLPESGIVLVDFRQPKEPAWEDSCGAAIIAGGLLEIAKAVPELEKELYEKAAVKILKAIAEQRADWSKKSDAIVLNCTAAYHVKKHHITMSYADYYFMEAIYKLKGTGILIW